MNHFNKVWWQQHVCKSWDGSTKRWKPRRETAGGRFISWSGDLSAAGSHDRAELHQPAETKSSLWTWHHLHTVTSSAYSEALEESLCAGTRTIAFKGRSVINHCTGSGTLPETAVCERLGVQVTAPSCGGETTRDHDGETAPSPLDSFKTDLRSDPSKHPVVFYVLLWIKCEFEICRLSLHSSPTFWIIDLIKYSIMNKHKSRFNKNKQCTRLYRLCFTADELRL